MQASCMAQKFRTSVAPSGRLSCPNSVAHPIPPVPAHKSAVDCQQLKAVEELSEDNDGKKLLKLKTMLKDTAETWGISWLAAILFALQAGGMQVLRQPLRHVVTLLRGLDFRSGSGIK